MDAHRPIAEAADEAWGRVALLLMGARAAGASRAELDALEDPRRDPLTILAALDYDPSDTSADRESDR